jgi:hypothetical protein
MVCSACHDTGWVKWDKPGRRTPGGLSISRLILDTQNRGTKTGFPFLPYNPEIQA